MNSRIFRRIVRQQFPQIRIKKVLPIVEGWDNFVYEINNEFMFRFPRRSYSEIQLEKEKRLLPYLARILSVNVPRFEFLGNYKDERNHSVKFVGYKKIQGGSLKSLEKSPYFLKHLAPQISSFLTELHSFPIGIAKELGVPYHRASEWRRSYEEFYGEVEKRVFPHIKSSECDLVRSVWERYLSNKENFKFKSVLLHRDLGVEHIICDTQKASVNGIIDWGDSAVGDPAFDFTGLLFDFRFAKLVLEGYRGVVDSSFLKRAIFYSKLIPFHTIFHGINAKDRRNIVRGLQTLRAIWDFHGLSEGADFLEI